MSQTNRKTGPLLMVAAAVLFSTGGILCKLIPWSALAINGVRNLFGAALIGIYLKVTEHRLKWNGTVAVGAICMIGVTTLFVLANKLTTAANAIVLQYSAPVWIILLMALIFHQKPKRNEIITICAVFAGILCFFFDSLGTGNLLGDGVALLSGLFYAGLFMLNSFPEGDSFSSLFFGQLLGGLVCFPAVFGETVFTPAAVGGVAFLGLFQVGLAYVFFSEGTKRTGPVTAALIVGIEPILNPILVAVFYGETIGPLSLAGACIVVGSILIYQLRSKG